MACKLAMLLVALLAAAALPGTSSHALTGHELATGQELAAEAQSDEANSAKEIMSVLKDNLNQQLHSPKWQWLNGILFLLIGKLLWWSGEASFRLAVTAICGLLTYIFVMSQLHETLEPSIGALMCVVISAEVGVCAAGVVWLGYDAVKFALGAVLGFLLAQWVVKKAAYHVSDDFATNKWFLIIDWNVCVLLGMLGMYGFKLTRWTLDIVSGFFGAALLSSCVGYFAAFFGTFMPGFLAKMGLEIDAAARPRGGFWIDYLLCIIDNNNPDVGIFSKTDHKLTIAGQVFYLDNILGRVAWLVLFALGMAQKVWMDKRAKRKAAEAKAKKGGATPAKAEKREGFMSKLKSSKGSKEVPLLA